MPLIYVDLWAGDYNNKMEVHQEERQDYQKSMKLCDDTLQIKFESKKKRYEKDLTEQNVPPNLLFQLETMDNLFELLKDPQNYDFNMATGEMVVKVIVHCMGRKSIVKTTPLTFNEVIVEQPRSDSLNQLAEDLLGSSTINNDNLKKYIQKQNQFMEEMNSKLNSLIEIALMKFNNPDNSELEESGSESASVESSRSVRSSISDRSKISIKSSINLRKSSISSEGRKRRRKRKYILNVVKPDKVYENGDTYTGGMKDGLPDGEGKFKYANGEEYEGSLKGGIKEGKGKYVFKNGDVYEGDFKDGLMDGEGAFSYANGDRYEGCFWKGEKTGNGKLTPAAENKYLIYQKQEGQGYNFRPNLNLNRIRGTE